MSASFVRKIAVLVACGLPTLTAGAAATNSTACFDEIEQSYQWDDGGFHWSAMPDRCPDSPQPASPAERKWGGSVQIRASGQDAMVIEESYAWAPKSKGAVSGCPHFFKTVTRRTRIASGGVLYETKQVDDEPQQRSQRPLRPNELIAVVSVQTAPKTTDSFIQLLGTDTVAGQPCQKVSPRQSLPGAGTYEMCIFEAPPGCRMAHYLQPLELSTRSPDGKQIWHGRTTSLRYGSRGQIVSPGSIHAP